MVSLPNMSYNGLYDNTEVIVMTCKTVLYIWQYLTTGIKMRYSSIQYSNM